MKSHKDLNVWKDSINLVKRVYEVTRKLPEEEKFLLVNQMRRAAVSVPSNIAEGAARDSIRENIHFLNISAGSLSELDTQLIICDELKYFDYDPIFQDEVSTVRKELLGLKGFYQRKLKN